MNKRQCLDGTGHGWMEDSLLCKSFNTVLKNKPYFLDTGGTIASCLVRKQESNKRTEGVI